MISMSIRLTRSLSVVVLDWNSTRPVAHRKCSLLPRYYRFKSASLPLERHQRVIENPLSLVKALTRDIPARNTIIDCVHAIMNELFSYVTKRTILSGFCAWKSRDCTRLTSRNRYTNDCLSLVHNDEIGHGSMQPLRILK